MTFWEAIASCFAITLFQFWLIFMMIAHPEMFIILLAIWLVCAGIFWHIFFKITGDEL